MAVVAFFDIPFLNAKKMNAMHARRARRPVAYPMTSPADFDLRVG
jgi:hypothetical protein